MPDDLADEFIREADLNGDGKIDYKGRFIVSSYCYFLLSHDVAPGNNITQRMKILTTLGITHV